MRCAAALLAASLATSSLLAIGCRAHDPNEATAVQSSALDVGAHAPSAAMTRPSGTQVAMAELVNAHDQTIVVFYRGFY